MPKLAILLAVLVFGSSAFAAAPPPAPVVAPTYNWAGFYIGGNLGRVREHDSGTSNFIDPFGAFVAAPTTLPQSNSFTNSSLIGGIHAGYNWQWTHWVAGVEADWDWTDTKNGFCRQTDINGAACSDNDYGFLTFNENTKWVGSARGRLGYAWDRLMVYGTGGVAWSRIDTSINASCLVEGCASSNFPLNTTVNFSDTRVGWVAGFGAEGMLNANWILRAEYLHYGFGSVTDTLNLPAFVPVPASFTQTATWSRSFTYDTVRAGLSYKFN